MDLQIAKLILFFILYIRTYFDNCVVSAQYSTSTPSSSKLAQKYNEKYIKEISEKVRIPYEPSPIDTDFII